MHKYRTHTCSEITKKNSGMTVKLSGWIHRKRDHGNLLFFDLRDHFGLTQCVIENSNNFSEDFSFKFSIIKASFVLNLKKISSFRFLASICKLEVLLFKNLYHF